MSILKTSHPFALLVLMSEDLYHTAGDELTLAPKSAETPLPRIQAQEAAVPETPVKTEPAFFEYLGENNKYILILVNEPAHPVIAPKELETLTNILKGKKQEIKDVAVVNLNKYPAASFKELKEFFACSSIVCFGINPGHVGIEGVQSNQITSHQGTKILATFSITEMLNGPDKKRIFWNEMKNL